MKRGLALLAVVGVLSLVAWRALAHPVDTYGDSAAGYIEHLERVRVLQRLGEPGGGLFDRLRRADGLYPPGLHLLSAPAAALGAHRPASVTWMGTIWLALTGLGAALVARRLDPRATGPAFVATLLVPALHAVAPRYYYDLPMTALVWMAAGVLALGSRTSSGVVAGLLFAVACAIKWSALPLGLAVLAAAAWLSVRESRRLGPSVAAFGVSLGLVLLGILGGSTSWGAMGGATFQPPPGAALPDWSLALDTWRPGLGHALGAMALQAQTDGLDRLGFYLHRFGTTVLSPALWLPAAMAFGAWLWTGARGGTALALAAVPTFAFVWLAVPPLDERFLLTLLPWLGVVAGLAVAEYRRGTGVWCGAGVLLGLWTAVDFHVGHPTVYDLPATPITQGLEVPWRPGLSTSADRRGWARADELPAHRGQLRSELLAVVEGCGSRSITGSDRVLSPSGDLNWWAFSFERSRLQTSGELAVFLPVDSPLGPLPTPPDLFVLPSPADRFGSAPAPPDGWEPLESPSPTLQIWARPGSCPSP